MENFEKQKLLSLIRDLEQQIINDTVYNVTIRVTPNYFEYRSFEDVYSNFILTDRVVNIEFTLKE